MSERLRPALGAIPNEIACVDDYERLAPGFMSPSALEYVAAGAGDEAALRANRAAFANVQVHNRLLRDVSAGSSATRLLGRSAPSPILLAPVAYHRLAHPDGELATVRGAEAVDAPMVVSTLSSVPLEEIAGAASAETWFQLYLQPEWAHTLDLVRRAEACGYTAIVLTLDAPIQPLSRAALRAGFTLPPGVTAANLAGHARPAELGAAPGQSPVFQAMAQAPRWSDFERLVRECALPILVKGVTHPDDAAQLVAAGAAGVVVSNHGGRVLDAAPASLAALPAVRARLGPQATILMDGGVRSGSDVFKALALGADAVLVGRPQLYALAVAGALGVAHMLKLLRDELEVCMALAGCARIQDIGRDALAPAPWRPAI